MMTVDDDEEQIHADIIILTISDGHTPSTENHRRRFNRYWLCLHHTVIIIMNTQISASMKVNWMTWPSPLTFLTTELENQDD